MKKKENNKENTTTKGISDELLTIINEEFVINKAIVDKIDKGDLTINSSNSIYSVISIDPITTTGNKISYSPYTLTDNFIYHVLGEDIELSVYPSTDFVSFIATLNVLGEPYYREFKKNHGTIINYKLDEFIEKRLKILNRDKIIGKLIKED